MCGPKPVPLTHPRRPYWEARPFLEGGDRDVPKPVPLG